MTLVFTGDDVKTEVSVCKLDVDIKNQMVVIGSIRFLNLSRNFLKEKVVLYSKFFENQMW